MKLQKERQSSTYCKWVLISADEKERKYGKKMKVALLLSHKTIPGTCKGRENKEDSWSVDDMETYSNNPVLSENQVLSTIFLGYQKIEGSSNLAPRAKWF